LPMMIIYVVADVGSISGGWISSAMIKNGKSVNFARKITMLICALAILPVVFAPQTTNQWIAVALIALAAGGHQAWSANIFAVISDVFPKKAVASITGIGGMVGYSAAIISDYFLGQVLTNSGAVGYVYAFAIGGVLYLATLSIGHLIMPGLKPLDEKKLKLI